MIRTISPIVAMLALLLAAGSAHAESVTYVLRTPGVV
jgi:hypothetical protein